MLESSPLLNLPAELREAIWREIMCPQDIMMLVINYPKMQRFIHHRNHHFRPDTWLMNHAVSFGTADSLRRVNRQIETECTAILKGIKNFNLLVHYDQMWEAWKDLASFLLDKKRINMLAIENIKYPSYRTTRREKDWKNWPLQKCLLPLLFNGTFDMLRLSYCQMEEWVDEEIDIDVALPGDALRDIQSIQEMEDKRPGLFSIVSEKRVDDSNSTLMILSRSSMLSKERADKVAADLSRDEYSDDEFLLDCWGS